MFWKVPSYSQASPLEGILEKQHITLEELLDEEDLIQVCMAHHFLPRLRQATIRKQTNLPVSLLHSRSSQ